MTRRDPRGPALLRAWRTAHDVTQAQLAERLGVSQSRVSTWERGQELPMSLGYAVAIEDVTGGEVPARAWVVRRDDEKER